MLIQPDCIPCILKMADALLGRLDLEENSKKRLRAKIADLPHLKGACRDVTSPEVIETIMVFITRTMHDSDPFSEEKARMNALAERLYPFLRNRVEQDPHPLNTAVRIAILGNAIDFMIHDKLTEVEALIQERLTVPVNAAAYAQFHEKIAHTHNLVYLCDNAGEIVFDRLLMETLKLHGNDLDIVAVVRSLPTLNDATVKEARAIGLTGLAHVVENGIDGPLPGTVPSRCSKQVRDLIAGADLIVSKGGGNFDTLEEVLGDLNTDIAFMLLSKCNPYKDYFATGLYQPVLYNVFLNENY